MSFPGGDRDDGSISGYCNLGAHEGVAPYLRIGVIGSAACLLQFLLAGVTVTGYSSAVIDRYMFSAESADSIGAWGIAPGN